MAVFDKPHRLKSFDYSSVCSYMLTFNVKDRAQALSEIIDHGYLNPVEVRLKPWGRITERYIRNIESVYHGVILENYVIMPDHVHLLLTLDDYVPAVRKDKPRISQIIRATKAMISREIGRSIWQLDFYDVVADTEEIFRRCDDYIDNNPIEWLRNNRTEPKDPK